MKLFKNIIFDLGGVIMDLDVHSVVRSFNDLGIKSVINSTGHHYNYDWFYKFETGHLSEEEFRTNLIELAGRNISSDRIDTAWNSMLKDIPAEKVYHLSSLNRFYRIFLLSNTNCIHKKCFTNIFDQQYGYDFNTLFHGIYYSYQLGLRKPDPEIFSVLISTEKLDPSESLFIDDSQENVDTARKCGLEALHVTQNSDWIPSLQEVLQNRNL